MKPTTETLNTALENMTTEYPIKLILNLINKLKNTPKMSFT